MMSSVLSSSRLAARVALLVTASVALSLGFACAVPLAAFAAIAAMRFARRDALIAVAAVWFVNQLVGFGVLHYPLDAATLAWGAALGVIALLSCEAARLAHVSDDAFDGVARFLAAFATYEGALVAINIVMGESAEYYAAATVTRVFLINACAFGALWAAATLLAKSMKRVASPSLRLRGEGWGEGRGV